MRNWQKILNGKGENFPSTEIQTEIEKLEMAGQELESKLPGLKRTMEKARQGLLSESVGASDRMREVQGAISDNENKALGILAIIKDLKGALKKALEFETKNRQKEIISEIAVIDSKIGETRLEIVEHFSKACVLYRDITGQDPSRFGFDFILNHNLSDDLWKLVAENSSNDQGASLYQKRQALSAEAVRLRKTT